MCGFVVGLSGEPLDDRLVRRRGPDGTGFLGRNDFAFRHYLLHITGGRLRQPLIDGEVVCVFNGEIYNQPYSVSDGEVIIPLYRKHGKDFARYLEGEFAIALYDFEQGRAVFVTDPFGTKPLWTRGARAASYGSCIHGTQMPPNTIRVVSFQGGETSEELHPFDFENQHKTHFDDWVRAFDYAVKVRATEDCFLGLSAGYDSGAIATSLLRQGLPLNAYCLPGAEDQVLLTERARRVSATLVAAEEPDLRWCRSFLKENVEEYSYASVNGAQLPVAMMSDDCGAEGSCLLYRQAAGDGRRVCLSGQGPDEIFADYPFWPEVSSLRGVFPENLRPWPNFQGGCQRAFLAKEEHVAGAFGIEARYPFLDQRVVQEFLWLSAELKNSVYKAPLHHYLTEYGFPFSPGVKTGFSAAAAAP